MDRRQPEHVSAEVSRVRRRRYRAGVARGAPTGRVEPRAPAADPLGIGLRYFQRAFKSKYRRMRPASKSRSDAFIGSSTVARPSIHCIGPEYPILLDTERMNVLESSSGSVCTFR